MKRYLWLIVGLLGIVAVAACGAPAAPGAQLGEPTASEPTRTPLIQVPDEALELVRSVRRQLAERLDQADDNIGLVDVESAEWPTAAMGCPEPDRMYADVVTTGYIVRLKTDGNTYEAHVSRDGAVVFCDGGLPVLPEQARDLVRQARTELAKRLGQADAALDVIDVEAAEWPTAAMGCPEPDKMYAQVVTPGYIVRLKTDGTVYEAHVSKGGQVVVCDAGEETRGMKVPTEAEPAVMAAKRDLASRAGVRAERVEVADFEAVKWSDASLGCPEPGKMYAQVITPGYRVVLKAAGQTYEYHTNRGKRAVLCPEGPAGAAGQKQRLSEVRELIERTRNELAQRLGVDVVKVSVAEVALVSELEEPAPCPEAAQLAGSEPAYQVTLQAGGDPYVYRAQGETVVLCTQ